MRDFPCPHCTFLNSISKLKCGMCLRYLRKRGRTEDDTQLPPPPASEPQTNPSTQDALQSLTQGEERARLPLEEHPRNTPCGATLGESCDDTEPPEKAMTSDGINTPENPTASSTAAAAPPLADTVVTLFSTAAGQKVSVRRASLQAAREKFSAEAKGDTAAPPTATVSTLFSTAAGRPVKVSAKALEMAKAKLQSDTSLAEERESQPPPPRGVSLPIAAEPPLNAVPLTEALASGAEARTMASEGCSEGPVVVPAQQHFVPPFKVVGGGSAAATREVGAGFGLPRRRGFVPPQRITADAVASKPKALPSYHAAPRNKLQPLRFNATLCAPPVVSPLPSPSAIGSGQFQFSYADCDDALARLFDIREGDQLTVDRWQAVLTRLGANRQYCTVDWTGHILRSSLMKVRQLHAAARQPSKIFQVLSVLLCCLQKYNQEIVDGERPALRKMVEGDVPCAAYVILYVSSLRDEQRAPHTRVVTLCDGFYHVRATCDVPLSNLLREKVLQPGQKIALCGAKSLLHSHCTPLECQDQLALSINYNCIRAVAADTSLGLCRCEPPPLPLSLVHPLGGLVPALDGIVARVLPPFYVAHRNREGATLAMERVDAARDGASKVVRNHHAQMQECDLLQRQGEADIAGAAAVEISRVTSLLLVRDASEALVQQWETIAARTLLSEDESAPALPMEGSYITIYALNPAKSRAAAAPFSKAKLFYSSRTLHHTPAKGKPLLHQRNIWNSATARSASTTMGDVADISGLYMGQTAVEGQGVFLLILLQDGMSVVLQVPAPTATRVISLSIPTAEKTAVLVLNATFVASEDSIAGSDCCRLLANEYTALVQRSSIQSNYKAALTAAENIRTMVDAAPLRFASRRAEIFRCLESVITTADEAVSGTAAVSGRYNSGRLAAAPPVEMPLQNEAMLTASQALQREARLPYYLRPGATVEVRRQGGGVRLLGAQRMQQSAPAVQRPLPPSLQRLYGNISDIIISADLHPSSDFSRFRLSKGELESAAEGALNATTDGVAKISVLVEVEWRGASNDVDRLVLRVEKCVLQRLMDACSSVSMLATLAVDERQVDYSVERTKTVGEWRRASGDDLWWKFFCFSRLLPSDGCPATDATTHLWWLPEEWSMAAKAIQTKWKRLFYQFGVQDGELINSYLISDTCSVHDLF